MAEAPTGRKTADEAQEKSANGAGAPRHVVRHDPRYDMDPMLRAANLELERDLFAVRQSRARAVAAWRHRKSGWGLIDNTRAALGALVREREGVKADRDALAKRNRELGAELRNAGIARSEAERRAERLEAALADLCQVCDGPLDNPAWPGVLAVAHATLGGRRGDGDGAGGATATAREGPMASRWKFWTSDDLMETEVFRCSCGNDFHSVTITYWTDEDTGDTFFDVSSSGDASLSGRLRGAWNVLKHREYVNVSVILTPRRLAELHAALGRRLAMLRDEGGDAC